MVLRAPRRADTESGSGTTTATRNPREQLRLQNASPLRHAFSRKEGADSAAGSAWDEDWGGEAAPAPWTHRDGHRDAPRLSRLGRGGPRRRRGREAGSGGCGSQSQGRRQAPRQGEGRGRWGACHPARRARRLNT